MPGLCHHRNNRNNNNNSNNGYCCSSSSQSSSPNGSCISNARKGIWSRCRDEITYSQLQKFWHELPSSARQRLLRIDKQSLFEQVRKNLYCSRCNGLLLEVYSQVVHYGRSLQQDVTCTNLGIMGRHNKCQNGNVSGLLVAGSQDDASDPSVHPWGGLTATRDGVLTLLDCFLVETSLEALQNVFDSGRAREHERELLYPDACGGGGRGWISQGINVSGRGHGLKETCALHTARLSCEALVDFWSALGEETRLSLLRMKEEDFIERLNFRFDSKRFCRDCRRNVLREFKELKELKRTRREPRCNSWFCVADTAFNYEVSDSAVQADWHEWFAEAGGVYHRFEWAVGTGEGKSDILGFDDVGLSECAQADGLNLENLSACYITLRAWKHDGRCTEICVKAHALEGRLCVHRRLVVGDGHVTITKGESINRFFEHAEETEEEEDEDSTDRDGNDMDNEGSRLQKHAKSPELARDFLLDAATVIFKEQVEKAFREGTARQNAHSIFVCLALGLLEDRVYIACKEIITLEKQNKLLEEEAAEKREEEKRKERKRLKEREKKLKRREKLKGKDKENQDNGYESKHDRIPQEVVDDGISNGENYVDDDQNLINTENGQAAPSLMSSSLSDEKKDYADLEDRKVCEEDMAPEFAEAESETCSKDGGSDAFIFGQSKSAKRRLKIRKSMMGELSPIGTLRKGNTVLEGNGHSRILDGYADSVVRSKQGIIRQPKNLKPEHFVKSDSRNGTVKISEKPNFSNGRTHYRYDYQFCGCTTHNSHKFPRESKSERSDSFSDPPRHTYRLSNSTGSLSDHFFVNKGRIKSGTAWVSREFVHKKVWEPLDSRQQNNKPITQSSNQNNKANFAEKSEVKNNVDMMSDLDGDVCPEISNLEQPENDSATDSDVQKRDSDKASDRESNSNATFDQIDIFPDQSSVCKLSSSDTSMQPKVAPGSNVLSCTLAYSDEADNHGVEEVSSCSPNSSEHDNRDVYNGSEHLLHMPCSKGEDVIVDKQENNGHYVREISFLENLESNTHARIVTSSNENCIGLDATKTIMTTSENTATPQILPMCIPSMNSPIASLHQHQQGYYPCAGSWHPIPNNGLLPYSNPSGFVFPGQTTYGLTPGRIPAFSVPYPSFQPLRPMVSVSQLPRYPHPGDFIRYNKHSSSCTNGDTVVDAETSAGKGMLNQENHFSQKDDSDSLLPSKLLSVEQDITQDDPLMSQDTSAFSLFHFGGPESMMKKESEKTAEQLRKEMLKELIGSKDAGISLAPKNGFPSQQDQVPVEEYSLFATSYGNRLPFFNQVH